MLPGEYFQNETTSERWDDDEFFRRREIVLQSWGTGEQVRDLDAGVAYSRSLPAHKRFSDVVRAPRSDGRPRFQVGVGHTGLDDQREHMRMVADAGADLILTQLDSYTRKSRYESAQSAIEQVAAGNKAHSLNGFPVTNYGLRCREVFESIDIPIGVNSNNDEENKLCPEIAFASGSTCDHVHSLHELVQHSRDYPLAKKIQTNQYAARLAAYYTERGAPIELISYSVFQGLIPPGLGIAISVLNVLDCAGQGPKYFSLNRGIEGCLVQDVAAFKAYRRVADRYLKQLGHTDVDYVFHSWPWMGGWPAAEHENGAVIGWTTAISILAGVDWIYLKSVHEGAGVPTPEANVAAVQIANQLRRMVPAQAVLASAEIDEEAAYLEAEACALIDVALDMGDGDPAQGQIRAVREGYLDVPMASWNGVAGEVLAGRDASGAVRYVHAGRIPLPDDVRKRNDAKIAQRKKELASSFQSDIELVIHDVRQFIGV